MFMCVLRINVLANNLFPPAEYPAPLGTPLISPYILWDHSQTWDIPKAEDFPTGAGGSGSATVYSIGVYQLLRSPKADHLKMLNMAFSEFISRGNV